jgi:hypothetical protein
MIGSISKVRPCGNKFYDKYIHCVNKTDLNQIELNHMNEINEMKLLELPNLTSGELPGLYINPPSMPKRTNYGNTFSNYHLEDMTISSEAKIDNVMNMMGSIPSSGLKLKRFHGYLPNLINSYYMFNGWTPLEEFDVDELPNCKISAEAWSSMFLRCTNLKEFHTKMPKLYKASNNSGMFEGCSILEDCKVEFPSLTKAERMFMGCILNDESVYTILSSVPMNDGTTSDNKDWKITMGIHIDKKYDPQLNKFLKEFDNDYVPTVLPKDETTGEDVEISSENDKGWLLKVEWNGNDTENAIMPPEGLEPDYRSEVTLPDGYTLVKYLESTGSQWINTEINPTNNTGIWVTAKTNAIPYSESYPAGCLKDNGWGKNTTCFLVPRLAQNKDYVYKSRVLFNQQNTMWDSKFSESCIYDGKSNWLNDKKGSITGKLVSDISVNFPTTAFSTDLPIYLFSVNKYGTSVIGINVRIYRAKISDGTTIIRDYVPCLDSDNKPCLYDVIQGQPYYNQGAENDFSYETYD